MKKESFDHYLNSSEYAALVIRESLVPAEGADAVVFPPTFADLGYVIDKFSDGHNVCLFDTVGSQGNRREPIFKSQPYNELVPQVLVRIGQKEVNILDAGHRAADAIVRCSELKDELHTAFRSSLAGDFTLLARIAPTSLVFGAWDSRDTYAKIPRIVSSAIRAFDVKEIRRSAQYFTPMAQNDGLPIDYTDIDDDSLQKPDDLTDKEGGIKPKHPWAKRGFVAVPAGVTHGGVIAEGGIFRDATLALAALRLIRAENEEATLKLRRYILGLSLIAFTAPVENFLRQGCLLVGDPSAPAKIFAVKHNGDRDEAKISHDDGLKYAKLVAKDFQVGENRTVRFLRDEAITDLSDDSKAKKAKKKAAKKASKKAAEDTEAAS
jgi:CRISPR-associated protein Csb1